MQPGDTIGQYTLLREIGKGAMATVFEAEHVLLKKRVALKLLHPHLARNGKSGSRFFREGKAASQIRSPHVVEVFDVAVHGDVPYLVMELLEGMDLAALLRDRRRLALDELVDLMLPVIAAVDAAHRARVVHRDLKPSNIFLVERAGDPPKPMVVDFGISKLQSELEGDLTESDVMLGTVHYMAPELMKGGKAATPLSDQYALGVILYEATAGARPFSGVTPYAVMHAIVSARPRPPSALNRRLPADFDEVVLRAMNRDPSKRFPTTRALGVALARWAGSGPRAQFLREIGVEGARAPNDATLQHLRRRAVPVGAAACALTASVAAYGWIHTHEGSSSHALSVAPVVAPAAVAAPLRAAPVEPPAAPPAASLVAPEAGDVESPPPEPRRAASPPVHASPVSRSPPSAPERGTNGALIVE